MASNSLFDGTVMFLLAAVLPLTSFWGHNCSGIDVVAHASSMPASLSPGPTTSASPAPSLGGSCEAFFFSLFSLWRQRITARKLGLDVQGGLSFNRVFRKKLAEPPVQGFQ